MKVVGSLLIIVSSIIATFFYEKKQRLKITGIKEISRFVEYIRNQIEFFSLPLNEIYEKYTPKSALIMNVVKGEKIGFFDKKIEDELSATFSGLGKGFKAEQVKSLDYLNVCLEKEADELEKSYAQKIKVFRAMALFIGCCAVILFV